MSDDDTTPTPAPAYTFPFEVPTDLAGTTDDALETLRTAVRDHAAARAAEPPSEDSISALRACRDLAVAVVGEQTARRDRATNATTLAAEVDAALAAAPAPAPASAPAPAPVPDTPVEPVEPAVTAARPASPSVRQVAQRTPTADVPPEAAPQRYVTMTASADVPGFPSGQELESFDHAARALSARLDQYPTLTAGRASRNRTPTGGERTPVTVHVPGGRTFTMRHYSRHSAVQLRRDFPAALRVVDGTRGYAVAEYAASERRLPGGSLVASARQAVASGRSLTAAAGWCAPSEVMYDLCELETRDGMLDLPELQTSRGGWQIPEDGGPDFGVIFGAIGDAGDTHLTEAEVIADTAKVCTDIPCPEFVDVRLGVDYVCLTGGLLQRRGYPEVVSRWSRGSMIALAHKINQGVIAGIVAASGAATVIPADPSGDDAISSLLSAVDLAITDAKYRNRMGFGATLEVVLPMWVLAQMRAAATRRRGVNMVGVTDQSIMDWFATRNAVPRFVYDWQDSLSGLVGGPGAAAPLTALPTTVQFLVYPAGTWVKAVQDVVNLDTIYDSTKLETNEYTAIFAEDGWAVLQLCPLSRLYTVAVDPSGVVGCCPTGS